MERLRTERVEMKLTAPSNRCGGLGHIEFSTPFSTKLEDHKNNIAALSTRDGPNDS